MPGMNGIALARAIGELRDEIPIILCSGYGDNFAREIEENVLAIKAFLRKPVPANVLSAKIREVVASVQVDTNTAQYAP